MFLLSVFIYSSYRHFVILYERKAIPQIDKNSFKLYFLSVVSMCNQIFSGMMNLSCLHYSFFFQKAAENYNDKLRLLQNPIFVFLPIAIVTSFVGCLFKQQHEKKKLSKMFIYTISLPCTKH